MSQKLPNARRPTRFIEWFRVSEDDGVYRSKTATLNAQRSTSNAQRASKPRSDLEDRLLVFSARIVRLVDSLPNTRAANHIAGQLLRSGTSPSLVTADRKVVDAAADANAPDPQRD